MAYNGPMTFANQNTESRIAYELLPLLEDILREELSIQTALWPDFDEEDERDIETSMRKIEAMISGYIWRMRDLYLDYWKEVDKLLNCESFEKLDQSIHTLTQHQ